MSNSEFSDYCKKANQYYTELNTCFALYNDVLKSAQDTREAENILNRRIDYLLLQLKGL